MHAKSIVRWCSVAALVSCLMVGTASAEEQLGAKYPELIASYDVQIPMRDGVHISALIFRPNDAGRHPIVFLQTPYGKDTATKIETSAEVVKRGYAVVSVDVRGRYDSEGTFRPFNDWDDGNQVLDWLAAQSWSNGKVVTIGASYSGHSQWNLWREKNPHHTAIVSYVGPADDFTDLTRFNGVPRLDLLFTWLMADYGRVGHPITGFDWTKLQSGLPLDKIGRLAGRDHSAWEDFMKHDRVDDYWKAMQPRQAEVGRDIPTMSVTGWYEGQLIGQIRNYRTVMSHTAHADEDLLIVGPWLHGVNRNRKVGELDGGNEAIIDLDKLRDEWMDHTMMGKPAPTHDHFLYFLPIKNEWRQAASFPVPGTKFTTWHFSSGGKANTATGDGTLVSGTGTGSPDAFTYDPANPVPSLSSRTAGARGGLPQGSVDYRKVEQRPDVLIYTGEALSQDVEVTGPVTATVYLESDAVDTDVVVRLVDVYPDGRAYNITEGVARAKYRDGFSKISLMEKGKVYKIPVELFPTSNYFLKGHKIRVEVTSSDFPVLGRNLNMENSDSATAMAIAHNKIQHSKTYPSAIELPVVPAGKSVRFNPPLPATKQN